jgi:signal peptide peptidase SppA
MYERIIREAMQTPWALTPKYLAIVQDILHFRASGGHLTAEELKARIGPAAEEEESARPRPGKNGLVAVIPVHGVIAHRTFEASSGMTSTEVISQMVKRATGDEEISTVLFDFCTPGGTSVGVPELAGQLFAARKVKRLVGIVNGEMCSAGHWLGAQMHELVSIPSGYCGSIGVWSLCEDWSEHLAKEGIKFDFIHAGENKYEGGRFWEPMSDETRAHLQDQVDKIYTAFLASVAKGRGTTVGNVKKRYGQGRVYDANEALERGMIDRIATYDELVAQLVGAPARRRTAAETPAAAPAATDDVVIPGGNLADPDLLSPAVAETFTSLSVVTSEITASDGTQMARDHQALAAAIAEGEA